MSKIFGVILLSGLALFAWKRYQREERRLQFAAEAGQQVESEAPPAVESSAPNETQPPIENPPPIEAPQPEPPRAAETTRHCDGRVYCSQMTSCEEATWFLENCPGVKMDNHGKGDGVPCERQWCGSH